MKRTRLKRYTKLTAKKPMRKVRSKPRPGRLKGAALEKLRRDCFERDGYRCQAMTMVPLDEDGDRFTLDKCLRRVTWETGHLAHIKAKRIGLDKLSNVRTLCAECHRKEHQYGPSMTKPVPAKGKE